jgi:uncharacterized protein YdhG (YjbR/CyaY superfamily)
MNPAMTVGRYIANAPKEVRPKLRQIRAAIRQAAPEATESMSYGMPHYSFQGESGFQSRLCYFGLLKGKNRLAFYTRPVFLEEYRDEVKEYMTSKSALQFRLDRAIPVRLIRKLVRNGVRKHPLSPG